MKYCLFVLIYLSSLAAFTCSCGPDRSVAEKMKNSAVVFSGVVESVTGGGWRDKVANFKVKKNWKGLDQQERVSVTTRSISASCGYAFLPGKTYLVFAHRAAPGASLSTTLCSGNKEMPF